MSKNTQKLFLVDGHGLCYRSFYAIKNLSTSDGRMTNAVFGFVNILNKIRNQFDPQYIAICFDSKKKTFRQQKLASYKINRPPMPEGLMAQIPIIKQVVHAFTIPAFELEGYEADDIIAALTSQAIAQGIDVVIITDDKDMFQLVSDHVHVYSSRKDEMVGREEVKAYLGVYPEQVVDFIALAGDSSDNIPGVSGIGKVTAQNLLRDFGSLSGIYKNLDSIKSDKLKEKLKAEESVAQLSRELAVLDVNVPFSFQLDQFKIEPPNKQHLFEIFQDLEFKKLAGEFVSDVRPPDMHVKIVSLVGSSETLPLIEKIKQKKKVAILPKYEDGDGFEYIKGIAVYVEDLKDVSFIPVDRISLMAPIFENIDVEKIVYDSKCLIKLLHHQGYLLKGRCFDVLLAGFLLSPSQIEQSIRDLSWKYLQRTSPTEEDLALNVKNIYDVYPFLYTEMKSKSLLELFESVEVPLSNVLASMEMTGVKLDLSFLMKMSEDVAKKIELIEKQLYTLAGEEFNLNSPKQLAKILFEKLKLPTAKKIKTGFSTNEEVLSKLAEKHEFPKIILEYRQMAKLKSTYIDALPKLINSTTNRIHAEFRQSGTETGRLSSRNPNLQNIPIRTEMGREIRKAFIPSSRERVLVAADYSQIELRILAHLSEDETLVDAFKNGRDIHKHTAALIFDVAEDLVTKDMRYAAKRVNFGIVYGMSAFGLAKDLNVSHKEAQKFIDCYFTRYPMVKTYMDRMIQECEEKGYVLTLLNRRRYIPEINNPNMAVRQFAQRQAINTPVQGTAADLIKIAMVDIDRELVEQEFESRMIITVHDELVFDVVKSEAVRLIECVKALMIKPLKLLVPIEVSVKTGVNWAEMNPLIPFV